MNRLISVKPATLKLIPLLILLFSGVMTWGKDTYISSDLDKALYWNKGRGYAPFSHATSEGVLISNSTGEPLLDSIPFGNPKESVKTIISSGRLSFRIDNRHAHPSRRYRYIDSDGTPINRKNPPWALFLSDTAGQRCWITVSKTETGNDDLLSLPPGTLVSISFDHMEESSAMGFNFQDKDLPFAGETLWNIDISSGRLRIIAGAVKPIEVAEIAFPFSEIASFGFAAAPGGEILISDISLVPGISPAVSSLNMEQIAGIIEESSDPIEGYWEIFDRTLEESLLKLGGDYKLAIVKNHDRYEIIYITGARVNGSNWKTGMLKGILTPSSFPGLFNLEWIDSEGKSLSFSITAQTGDADTMTLQFPYHSSLIRLRKTGL